MKDGFLDKLITRLDRFSPSEVQNLVSRLVREKGFMENVFASLREGVLILDPDGVITFTNTASHRLIGIDAVKSIGQKINTVLRGIEWDKLANPSGVITRDLEIFYPENRFINFYLAPINGQVEENNTLLGYVLLMRDVTDSKKEREETIESEQLNALTLLAAGVAHEIGNPLNSIDIHLQLMSRKIQKTVELSESSKSDLEGLLNTAQKEIKRLDNILKQFLHAIRPQSLQRESYQLHQILQETLKTLEAELTEREVQVSLNLHEQLPLLQLDNSQIQQALYNLIRNAAQAVSSKSGEISISSDFNDHEVTLSISDNGNGISPEQMGALFEPYSTTKSTGTGLGLLIVRRILREHGGEIEIDSNEGLGTSVTLYFPRTTKHVRMLEQAPDDHTLIDIETSE